MAFDGNVVSIKYHLFFAGVEDPPGKVDRIDVPAFIDPEEFGIAVRDAIQTRRGVRDCSHCSAANIRLFSWGADGGVEEDDDPEEGTGGRHDRGLTDPRKELDDAELQRQVLEEGVRRIKAVVPPPPQMAGLTAAFSSAAGAVGGRSRRTSSSSIDSGRGGSFTKRVSDGGGSGIMAELPIPSPSAAASVLRRDSSMAKREPSTMVVFVKTLAGQTIPVEIESSATVDDVKARIFEEERIPVEQQRLMFAGNEIQNGRSIGEYNIREGSDLHLLLTLRGGASPY
eukprot:TRINITY_DN6348_c0_g1_i1.p1 TRINITY_DN6348_c0_g1~~TRINITY_DN6348_c0_g1_i1.p1  ORF type:complete len:284 (+),score=85.72 TRINITY_DN6348_c0_g1_i1:148-999(+)